MIKNILVPLTGFECDANALQAARLVGVPFGANIVCLRVQPDPMQIVTHAALGQFGSALGNVEHIHRLEKEGIARTASARQTFEDFSKRYSVAAGAAAREAIAVSLREFEGDPVADTIRAARYSDLVVLGRTPRSGDYTTDAIASILVGCGRAVLLVPEKLPVAIGSNIGIAWKETAEAARAVSAAMPVLSLAKRIVVLTADETQAAPDDEAMPAERLAKQLALHGLAVEARNIVPGKRGMPEALLQSARDAGADLLVMGAYSHSRFRELVFGGFTRHILDACDLPVLLLH